ncbi:ABC transporter ATP-binding protein [uncultured Campylobacter sp.]|uniref:ABC transporter ATP-binding protein n=1 Tax=uncultured Campylobacter sp. TaxID=218934 RepID=UPI00262E916A|nr:ABC transporter ATP-binding protein [uncultured Campylobacter sp.]
MKVENLYFSYGHRDILKDINFNVEDGEIVTVLGVNGVGKSTLMKCLAGVLRPTKGMIDTNNISINKIGYLSQNIMPNDALSVFEFVLLGRVGELRLRVSDEDLDKVWAALKHVGIVDFAKLYFNELSGGQQRLVLVAQLLAREPKIMFLDEPTANLDLKHQKNILELFYKYSKANNIKTVINIHDINHAIKYGDKILVLKDGKVRFFDDKSKLDIEILEEIFDVDFEIFINKNREKIIVNY